MIFCGKNFYACLVHEHLNPTVVRLRPSITLPDRLQHKNLITPIKMPQKLCILFTGFIQWYCSINTAMHNLHKTVKKTTLRSWQSTTN